MEHNKEDIRIICKDCKAGFDFTVGEQNFFEELLGKGKVKSIARPKRCPDCRVKYKAYKDSFKHSDIS